MKKPIKYAVFLALVLALITKSDLLIAQDSIHVEQMKHEVWQMEERYWTYVEDNNITSYKTLWHENFIGYPGKGVAGKNHIADWITDLFKDKNLQYSYELHKKAVNVIDDVVMTFYDVDDIMTNKTNKAVSKETYKITHTWKKYGDTWLIIGGMSGK